MDYGFVIAVGVIMIGGSAMFGAAVMAYLYKKFEQLQDKDNALQIEVKEARMEMQTITSAYQRNAEETHATLLNISMRLDNLEVSKPNPFKPPSTRVVGEA